MARFLSALGSVSCIALLSVAAMAQPATRGEAKPKLYNTARQKLLEGKRVFSFTQSKFDVAGYFEAAKHCDYAWFEMQHSTLEFKDVEAMIAACPHAGAIPMIRLPDDADRARYPPVARRSTGQGHARAIWGINGIGKIFGQANARYAKGHPLSGDAKFFQNGRSNDGWKPGGSLDPSVPPPGEEDKPAGAVKGSQTVRRP